MRFTCSQISLNKALNTVSRAVSAKTTMPILKGILLEAKGQDLCLTASDLDISIRTSTSVSDVEEGSTVVNAKMLGDIVRKLPNSLIRVETDEKGFLRISCLGSEFTLVTFPAEEYPSIGEIDKKSGIKLNGYALRKLIRRTSFAASIDEKKGILVGCLVNMKNDYLEMVSLDGFRMAVAKEDIAFIDEKNVIVPAASLDIIEKILTDTLGEKPIDLYIEEKKLSVVCEETTVIARLLEGNYIKYKDIIPNTYSTRVVINRSELLSSLERASLFAREGKNNLIKISVGTDNILLSSRSEEGNINESVSAETEGNELVIGFNSKYIMDVLKVLEDDEISIEMSSSTSAALIKPVEGDAYTYLVLPVRILGN
ncbi:MAG: DNA polymerase III subunit beta [Firmicutes bacterium]|nr:DNA polymerase III subunit beta [Bacillota bacterium]